jgi:hypothetical protein
MKTRARSFPIVLLAVVGLAAVLQAQKTSYDFDKTADFATFTTYAWQQGTPAREPFLDKRIVAAIDERLAAKGLTRTESSPDVYVAYHVGVHMERRITGSNRVGPFGPAGGLDAVDGRITDLPVGALVIDLSDAARQELVWRGIGMKAIDINAKPEKRDAAIVRIVEKILTNYPPRTRG